MNSNFDQCVPDVTSVLNSNMKPQCVPIVVPLTPSEKISMLLPYSSKNNYAEGRIHQSPPSVPRNPIKHYYQMNPHSSACRVLKY